jgi:hypothetical protein
VFDSVVVVAFQIVFRAEIHANDVFSFFKNYFWHQHIKTIQKVQTALNFNKKNIEIWSNAGSTAKQALNLLLNHFKNAPSNHSGTFKWYMFLNLNKFQKSRMKQKFLITKPALQTINYIWFSKLDYPEN